MRRWLAFFDVLQETGICVKLPMGKRIKMRTYVHHLWKSLGRARSNRTSISRMVPPNCEGKVSLTELRSQKGVSQQSMAHNKWSYQTRDQMAPMIATMHSKVKPNLRGKYDRSRRTYIQQRCLVSYQLTCDPRSCTRLVDLRG